MTTSSVRTPTDLPGSLEPRTLAYELEFESVSDASMPPDLLADRQQKERESLDGFRKVTNRIATMRDCHRWLFTAHDAYNAAGRGSNRRAIDSSTLRSY
jgi:hypothetical protein